MNNVHDWLFKLEKVIRQTSDFLVSQPGSGSTPDLWHTTGTRFQEPRIKVGWCIPNGGVFYIEFGLDNTTYERLLPKGQEWGICTREKASEMIAKLWETSKDGGPKC